MSRINIGDELNILVNGVLLAQSKGVFTLEEAEQLSLVIKSLKQKLNSPKQDLPIIDEEDEDEKME